MNMDKIYVGIAKPTRSERRLGKKDLPWFVGVWIICIILAYTSSSFAPIAYPIVVSFMLITSNLFRGDEKSYIKIRDGWLSIHMGEVILWSTLLRDIVSIKLEGDKDKRLFFIFSRRKIVVRNNKNESYSISIDIEFNNLSPDELVEELNEIVKQNS